MKHKKINTIALIFMATATSSVVFAETKEDILKVYYPEGSIYHTTSLVVFNAEGSAISGWDLGELYELEFIVESIVSTEVLANDGEFVNFEIKVPSARAIKLATKSRLTFNIHGDFTTTLLKSLRILAATSLEPTTYAATETALFLLNKAETFDPGFEDTLSLLFPEVNADYSKGEISKYRKTKVGEVAAKVKLLVDEIEGTQAKFTYYSDGRPLKVDPRSIREINSTGELKRHVVEIAEQVEYFDSTLASYFLYPHKTIDGESKIATAVGDEWVVNAKDVSVLMRLDTSSDIVGHITVKRRKDTKDRIVLEVISGEVNYRDFETKNKHGRAHPTGFIYLKPIPNTDGGYFVDEATLKAQGNFEGYYDGFIFEEKIVAEPEVYYSFLGEWTSPK